MDRKEFLTAIGMGAASVAVLSCIGCGKSDSGSPSSTAPTNVDFTLDLTTSANSALKTNGGYLATNGIVVARTLAGAYIAVSQYCPHENYPVTYKGNLYEFYCPAHGATFAESGTVTSGPTNRSLAQYKTQLTGTSLRIYS